MKRDLPLLRVLSLLVFAFLLLILTSCKVEKYKLDEKYYNPSEVGLTDVELDLVNEEIKNKGNFALFIYLDGCTTCSEFEPIVSSFLEENNMMMYSLSYDKMEKGSDLKKTVKYSPSVVLFKNGKIVAHLDTSKDEDTERFRSFDAFKEWFESYIELK